MNFIKLTEKRQFFNLKPGDILLYQRLMVGLPEEIMLCRVSENNHIHEILHFRGLDEKVSSISYREINGHILKEVYQIFPGSEFYEGAVNGMLQNPDGVWFRPKEEPTKEVENMDKVVNGKYFMKGDDTEQQPCATCGRMTSKVNRKNEPICNKCIRWLCVQRNAKVECRTLGGRDVNRHFAGFRGKDVLVYPAGDSEWTYERFNHMGRKNDLEVYNRDRVQIDPKEPVYYAKTYWERVSEGYQLEKTDTNFKKLENMDNKQK